MPKRKGYLYERMCDKEAIRIAIIKGSKGKKKRADVKMVLADVDGYVDKVYDMLIAGSFVPTPPKELEIKDASSGKQRVISVVPYYPDGIMHQLIVMAMQDVLMRGMYHWSCASIPGRGNAHALTYTKRAMRDRKGTKYCAKLDIRHYYPSIDTELVIEALERKIKDKRFLALVRSIIESGGGGLSIGFYLNQWLANFFLEPLDHHICTLPGVKRYVRNMDDIVLMGPNKRKLHRAVDSIRDRLAAMGLAIKGNWQVFKADSRGIDFVGFRCFHGRTILRRRNFLKLARQCRKARRLQQKGRAVPLRMAISLVSRIGQLKHCDSQMIRDKYVDPIGLKKLKNIIRRHARLANAAARKGAA